MFLRQLFGRKDEPESRLPVQDIPTDINPLLLERAEQLRRVIREEAQAIEEQARRQR